MTSIPPEDRPRPDESSRGIYECLADGVGELATGSFAHALEWMDRHRMPAYLLVVEEEPEGMWRPVLTKGVSTPEARKLILDGYGLAPSE